MKNYDQFRRLSARLKGYDYSLPGCYFVTICIKNRELFFGDVVNNKMYLSRIGRIAKFYWLEIPKHYPMVRLAEFIVMPNHIHGILLLTNVATQNLASLQKNKNHIFTWQPLKHYNKFGPQSMNLSSIIRGFKIAVRKYAIKHNKEFFWQRRFHDRIIRNQDEYEKIKLYIKTNFECWTEDRNNPENFQKRK